MRPFKRGEIADVGDWHGQVGTRDRSVGDGPHLAVPRQNKLQINYFRSEEENGRFRGKVLEDCKKLYAEYYLIRWGPAGINYIEIYLSSFLLIKKMEKNKENDKGSPFKVAHIIGFAFFYYLPGTITFFFFFCDCESSEQGAIIRVK